MEIKCNLWKCDEWSTRCENLGKLWIWGRFVKCGHVGEWRHFWTEDAFCKVRTFWMSYVCGCGFGHVVWGVESSSPSELSFFGQSSSHDVSWSFLLQKQVGSLWNGSRCFKDKTTSEILFHQPAATFNKSLFTRMLSIRLFESVTSRFNPHSELFYISSPVMLIKLDFENNQISFM